MSTRAIIRFCNENKEAGAIVIHHDGYPQFARDQLLKDVAERYENEDGAQEAMDILPLALADIYSIDIFAPNDVGINNLRNCYTEYDTFEDAVTDQAFTPGYQYTVHVVNGKIYY